MEPSSPLQWEYWVFGFRRRSMLPGWVACVPQGAQAMLAHVEQPAGQRPSVRWVAMEPWAKPGRSLRALDRRRALGRCRRVLVLAREQYRTATLDTPADVPRADWAAATRWQLKDTVDFAVDSAAIDVLAVPEGASYRAQPQLIAVAAAEAEVRPLVEAAHRAGLPWQAIDINETALRNLGALVEPPGRAQALLHCQPSHSTLVVTYGGELLASRQFELTLGQLASSNGAARQQAYDQAVLELQRTLDGIERSFGQVSLSRLVITPMPGLERLCEHLGPLLYVPVAAFDAEAALDLSEVPQLLVEPGLLNSHLCAIGAALRGD